MKKTNDKISISNVIINIGGKELKLTVQEARELQAILNDTFPAKEKEYVYIPSSPIIIDRPCYPSWPYPTWTQPIITCNSKYGSTFCITATATNG